MFNSQYYTCEQVDERLLQGYVDDFNEVNSTNYSKEDLLLKLFQAINWDQVFGKYEENPEFVRVYIDATKKVLWGIRANGDIYYGTGVPSQIRDYIDSKIRELHLDKVDDILVFLDDLLDSDKTLKELLEELDIKKVDKEEGKSLIDADFASGITYIESPEFKEVKLDAEDKILEAIYNDGTKLFPVGFSIDGVLCKTLHCPEFLAAWLYGHDHLIMAFKKDGDILFGIGVPSQIKQFVIDYVTPLIEDINALIEDIEGRIGHYDDNPEFVDVLLDSVDKILEGHKKNGNKYFGTPVENDAAEIRSEYNPEGFIEVTTDNKNRIINLIDDELEDIHYGGINISEMKRDLDNETLLTDCDEDGIIYTVENNDSTITLEVDDDLNLYEVKDSHQTAEIVMEEETGDIYLEQTLKDM